MYAAANAQRIVDALKETEADSESNRMLSARAVELLHESGVTRIVAPALRRLPIAGARPWSKPNASSPTAARRRPGC